MSDETTPDLTAQLAEVIQKRLSWASLHWFPTHTRGGIKVPLISSDIAPEIAKAVLAAGFGPVRAVEAERDDLRDQVGFLENELDADAKHAALAEGESCDVCTHLESEQVQQWMAMDPDWQARAESAEAALAGAWEQAHDVFCPRRDACSTHLRPGDRHLLAPTPDREEARDD